MKYYIQFLSTHTPDSSPAFLVHFDSQRYLFNCSEGTQRLINENKIHLGKIKNLFFTRSIWGYIGGLPGMVLTLADSGAKEFGIHGPRNLLKCFVGSRNFLQRSQVNFKVHEFLSSDEKFVDENLTIIPVPIYSSKKIIEEVENEYEDHPIIDNHSNFTKKKINVIDNRENSNVLNRKILKAMFSGRDVGTLSSSKLYKNDVEIPYTSDIDNNDMDIDNNEGDKGDSETNTPFNIDDYRNVKIKQPKTSDYSLCYICQSHLVPGKFNPKKAKELGVIPGKQFGVLAKGECVTTRDGKIVRPEQVKEPDKISSIFIIVDCPTLDHIPSLINQERFKDPEIRQRTKNIIHILGDPGILKNEQYKAWMNGFADDCKHVIASRNYCTEHINFLSNAYMQYKLNIVDPVSFPLLYFNNEVKETLTNDPQLPKHIVAACNNLQIHIEPKEQLDYSRCKENFNLNNIPEKIVDKLKNNAEAIQSVKFNIDQWRQKHPLSTYPTATDIEVVTLGTGSALPSKYRNVSSTIILSKRSGNVLLDAGEGTFGQICRHFGLEKTLKEVLPNIRMIFVSHIHADHHLGMINILSTMAITGRKSDNPLYIVAPEKFNIWLEEYANIQDIGLHRFIKVVPSYLLFRRFINAYTNHLELFDYLNMSNIETVPVMHVRGACAIVFDYKDCSLETNTKFGPKPIRLAYSGDCRPNRDFIRAGMNADILIHESTFESELNYEAVKKFHCTINEACIVGRCMRTKFLLLTHFSQRYPKVPLFPVFKSNDDSSISNLLHSKIFDVLPTYPYTIHGTVRSKANTSEESGNKEGDENKLKANPDTNNKTYLSINTNLNINEKNDENSAVSTTMVTPSLISLANSTSVSADPSSESELESEQESEQEPEQKPEQKPESLSTDAIPIPLPNSNSQPSSHLLPSSTTIPSLKIIPTERTERGLPFNQIFPSADELITQIEEMTAAIPDDSKHQMKIGMAVDHFHFRVGYDENCIEWITEALRLLIPDDEEEEGDNEGDDDDSDEEEKGEKRGKRKRKNSKDNNSNSEERVLKKKGQHSKKNSVSSQSNSDQQPSQSIKK